MAGSLGVLFAVVGHVRLRLILIGYLDRRKRDVCFRSAWQVLGGFIWSLCLAGICFKMISMVSDWEMLTDIVFVLIKRVKTSNKRAFTRYFKKLLGFCLISFFVYTVYFIPGFCLRGDCNFMGGLCSIILCYDINSLFTGAVYCQ